MNNGFEYISNHVDLKKKYISKYNLFSFHLFYMYSFLFSELWKKLILFYEMQYVDNQSCPYFSYI